MHSTHSHHGVRRSKAFSISELLTVITLITAGVGILVPLATAVRQDIRVMNCISNMRQIALGMNLYRFKDDTFFLPRLRFD